MAESKYNITNSKNKNVVNTSIDITDDSKYRKLKKYYFIGEGGGTRHNVLEFYTDDFCR